MNDTDRLAAGIDLLRLGDRHRGRAAEFTAVRTHYAVELTWPDGTVEVDTYPISRGEAEMLVRHHNGAMDGRRSTARVVCRPVGAWVPLTSGNGVAA